MEAQPTPTKSKKKKGGNARYRKKERAKNKVIHPPVVGPFGNLLLTREAQEYILKACTYH